MEDNRIGGSDAKQEVPAAGGDTEEGRNCAQEATPELAGESRLLSSCFFMSLLCPCVRTHVRVFICVCSMQQVGIRKSPATVLFASQQLECENICVVRSSPVLRGTYGP